MEQSESNERPTTVSASGNDAPTPPASPVRAVVSSPVSLPCPTCGVSMQVNPGNNNVTTSAYIYALGRIEPRFPSLAVEKEFAQATGRAETAGLTDREAVQQVLAQRQNRYLARQLCWVLTIEGLETYILQARDPVDFDLLVEAIRPAPSPMDMDVVIGRRGPIAPPVMCNGLMIPIVAYDQIIPSTGKGSSNPFPSRRRSLPKSSPRQPGNCSTGSCRWQTMRVRLMRIGQ